MVGHIRKVSSIYSGLFRMQQLFFYLCGISGDVGAFPESSVTSRP